MLLVVLSYIWLYSLYLTYKIWPTPKTVLHLPDFCSWSCVKSYNFDSSNHKKYECSSLITLLLQQIHGVSKAIRIKPAPPRQCLKMFGGYMDIETFRGDTDVDQYNLNLLKFNYIYPEVTEIRNVKNKIEKKNFRLSRPVF